MTLDKQRSAMVPIFVGKFGEMTRHLKFEPKPMNLVHLTPTVKMVGAHGFRDVPVRTIHMQIEVPQEAFEHDTGQVFIHYFEEHLREFIKELEGYGDRFISFRFIGPGTDYDYSATQDGAHFDARINYGLYQGVVSYNIILRVGAL